MLDVIGVFAERDTRDELGIGTVRDAFADIFFPGTSTLQRRARYFLFIPWMYLDLERRHISSREIAAKARREETALIDVLAKSTDHDGTIGIQARSSLKRLASNIYWQGLGVWGIRLFPGSQEQYQRLIERYPGTTSNGTRDDDGERAEGAVRPNWHLGIPSAPGGFPTVASFNLKRPEAEYLRERILSCLQGTLLAFLVDHGRIWQPVDFPWEHPQVGEFPVRIRDQLAHARNFSESIWGTALLYNLMLAELGGHRETIADYQERLRSWAALLEARKDALTRWDQRGFWGIAHSGSGHIPITTKSFIDTWLGMALSPEAPRIGANQRARQLIHDREVVLKRALARLDNFRARELWNGEAGTAQLSYRWPIAQTMVLDILRAVEREEPDA